MPASYQCCSQCLCQAWAMLWEASWLGLSVSSSQPVEGRVDWRCNKTVSCTARDWSGLHVHLFWRHSYVHKHWKTFPCLSSVPLWYWQRGSRTRQQKSNSERKGQVGADEYEKKKESTQQCLMCQPLCCILCTGLESHCMPEVLLKPCLIVCYYNFYTMSRIVKVS